MSKVRISFLLVCFLLLVFGVLGVISARKESLTWDEIQYFKVGYQALVNNDYTVDPLGQPFIPQLVAMGQLVNPLKTLPVSFPSDNYSSARLTVSLLSVLLGFAVFIFARNYFGYLTGLISVSLLLFEPTFFANSHYITTDIGLTLLFFITYWLYLLFLFKPNLILAAMVGLSTAFLISAKITGLGFLAITLVILFILERKRIKVKPLLRYLAVLIITVVLGIWFTYRFSWSSLGGFTDNGVRKSNEIEKQLRKTNPLLADYFKKVLEIKLPLGGFLRVSKNTLVYNLSPKESFFLGQMRENPGRYCLLLFLLKTSLPFLIFICLGIITIAGKRKFRFLLYPVVGILLFVSLSNTALRLRYILAIYPFLAVIGALGFVNYFRRGKSWIKLTLFLLLAGYFFLFGKNFPHLLAYTNQLSNIFNKPYLNFSDSNLDWGQGLIALNRYALEKEIGVVRLSYFGTDNPNLYGFSGFAYGNFCKKSCTIEDTYFNKVDSKNKMTAISVTNFLECSWYKDPLYGKDRIKEVVGGSILIFD